MNDKPKENPFSAPGLVGSSPPNSASLTESRQLQLSASEILSAIGAVCFLISLALPAIKHGQDQLGINCFTLSLFCVFGSSPSPLANERQLMSIASHAMHVSVFASFVMTWLKRPGLTPPKAMCAIVAIPCALFVLTVPYSSIETVYFGFYLWLTSMAVIAVALFLPNTLPNAG